jgi:hypothetical protein
LVAALDGRHATFSPFDWPASNLLRSSVAALGGCHRDRDDHPSG